MQPTTDAGGGMRNILVINSSAAGDDAASRVLVRSVVEALKREAPGATVVERDVGEVDPIRWTVRQQT